MLPRLGLGLSLTRTRTRTRTLKLTRTRFAVLPTHERGGGALLSYTRETQPTFKP